MLGLLDAPEGAVCPTPAHGWHVDVASLGFFSVDAAPVCGNGGVHRVVTVQAEGATV